MEVNLSIIEKAYRYLKTYAYHENLNLFLKQRVAAFESSEFDRRLKGIRKVLNNREWKEDSTFQLWLDEIDYHLLPKSVCVDKDLAGDEEAAKKDVGLFISNKRSSENYKIEGVNYFIDAPSELHIVDTLWAMIVGPAMELKLTPHCYANRLHQSVIDSIEDRSTPQSTNLFKRYIDQYNQWRDKAVDTANEIAQQGEDVAVLSLDLQSYFYHISMDFSVVYDCIYEFYKDDEYYLNLSIQLTKMLEEIYSTYQSVTQKSLKCTHPECTSNQGLPIGFHSSAIIANSYLADFDQSIVQHSNPIYYGRYVDDILLVVKNPVLNDNDPIGSFVDKYFYPQMKAVEGCYAIEINGNTLPLQKNKLMLQFFDKDYSRAGLELFKHELDERSSAFKFLPGEYTDKELDKFAYDILYKGSPNKFKSIIGLEENEAELAKYLSSQIMLYRLCKADSEDKVIPELMRIFKGKNILEFSRLWEKVYQYAVVTKNYSLINELFLSISQEAKKLRFYGNNVDQQINIDEKLYGDLVRYNKLSLALSLALLKLNKPNSGFLSLSPKKRGNFFISEKYRFNKAIFQDDEIHRVVWFFRSSNLVRHHLVAWPLVNYSNFLGDLTLENNFITSSDIKIDDQRIDFSPRFIHFEEWQLFHLKIALVKKNSLNQWFDDSLTSYRELYPDYNFPVGREDIDNDLVSKSSYTVGVGKKPKYLKVAIANLVVDHKDIQAALRKDQVANTSDERQRNLYNVLNSTVKEEADLLVMPEVAIPVSWLPFMLAFARRRQIAIVFGLEHWVVNNVAYNLLVEALPFKSEERYKSCAAIIRVKNHYAPQEQEVMQSLRLKRGDKRLKQFYYHKVRWRGISFATYNCYELSNITHRILFKSEIDMLLACVWNKDTNYYTHILESTVRDLHCYTVQSNTSQYGGSCILRPAKTETKTMLYVKGGENPCVLTAKLDIASLREFQYRSTPRPHDEFKHLPPGYDSDAVLNR